VQVLVEKATPDAETVGMSGYTDAYARVTFPGTVGLVGRVVDVLVASAENGRLEGELVE